MRIALAAAALLTVASFAASGVPQGAGQVSKRNDTGTATLQPQTATDDLLKYQQFLRKESDEEHADLDRFIQWMTYLAALAGILIVALGYSTNKEIRSRAKNELRTIESEAKLKIEEVFGEMQRTSRARFESRFAKLEETYDRRQLKYFMLLESYFLKLFEVDPSLCSRWLGIAFEGHHFRGKRVLWVDDDCVGIAMLVALLNSGGIKNETCRSTAEALDQPLSSFDLIVSNLRRDPDDNAGLLMTQKIRNEKQSKIPIIIFTRPEHIAEYGEELTSAGVDAIATSDRELFPSIAKLLDKNAANGEG
jgi:CheY-like chemotaxis protein